MFAEPSVQRKSEPIKLPLDNLKDDLMCQTFYTYGWKLEEPAFNEYV